MAIVAAAVADADAWTARGLEFQPVSAFLAEAGFQALLGAPAGPGIPAVSLPDGAAPVPRPFVPPPYLAAEVARRSADPAPGPTPTPGPRPAKCGAASPRDARAMEDSGGREQGPAASVWMAAARNPGTGLPAGVGGHAQGLTYALPTPATGSRVQGPAASVEAAATLNPGTGSPAGGGGRALGLTTLLPAPATSGGETAARLSVEDTSKDAPAVSRARACSGGGGAAPKPFTRLDSGSICLTCICPATTLTTRAQRLCETDE